MNKSVTHHYTVLWGCLELKIKLHGWIWCVHTSDGMYTWQTQSMKEWGTPTPEFTMILQNENTQQKSHCRNASCACIGGYAQVKECQTEAFEKRYLTKFLPMKHAFLTPPALLCMCETSSVSLSPSPILAGFWSRLLFVPHAQQPAHVSHTYSSDTICASHSVLSLVISLSALVCTPRSTACPFFAHDCQTHSVHPKVSWVFRAFHLGSCLHTKIDTH